MSTPVITFLSDYGWRDDFVGVCHGVMATICPAARIIDITHGIGRHDVLAGALALAESLPYMPLGVHLGVVDPDVGAERRAVALAVADGRRLVGPDNGLLTLAAVACGGVTEAVDIAQSPFRLQPVSATFHGRDIFAPVTAHLAAGLALGDVGRPCDPDGLVGLQLPQSRVEAGRIVAHALYIDGFGNIGLDVTHSELSTFGLKLGQSTVIGLPGGRSESAVYVRTFAEASPGELLVYEDAYQRLAVAVCQGDAASRLDVAVGNQITVWAS